jgi:LysM repeat protein
MREKFLANLSKIPEGKRFTVHVYRVKRGDTVSEIADRTGVPQRVIISYNKLNRRGFITTGQKLLIPVGLAANSKMPQGKPSAVQVYRVRHGDTISGIAQRTGVSQRAIISYNKLNSRGFITKGQKLIIPVGLAAN